MKFGIDKDLERKLRQTGYDPGFIRYLVEYLLGESEAIELMPSDYSTDMSYRKRVKRDLKKAGEPYSIIRSILKKPSRKALRPLARKNKYGYELIDEPTRGRPTNDNFWALIFCLKNYVKKWGLIIEIIDCIIDENEYPLFRKEEDTLRSEWSRHKEKFQYLNAEGFIYKLQKQCRESMDSKK